MRIFKFQVFFLLLVVFSLAIFLPSFSENAFGQGNVMQDLSCTGCVNIPNEKDLVIHKNLGLPLIMWTNDFQYIFDHNSRVSIIGYSNLNNPLAPITVRVTDPIGNLVTIDQLMPQGAKDFKFQLNTSGPLWKKDGMYIVKIQAGPTSTVYRLSLELLPGELGNKFQCRTGEIVTPGDNGGQYCIPFDATGEITSVEGFLKTRSTTLVLNVRGNGIDTFYVDIDRVLLNSKSGDGRDTTFVVLLNGLPVDFEEHSSNFENHRRLAISHPPDREGTIEIIGTHAIPEFGTIALLILVIAITSILVISRKGTLLSGTLRI